MNWEIPLFDPDLGEAELEAVAQVVRSKWLTMGGRTAQFESEFASLVGCQHAVALNSCTAALHVALLALDVGPGDEVICPALTFVATANAIRYCGARPVFADVDSLECWNVSRASLEAVATPNTKAVMVVHYGGYPCAMPEILAFAKARGLSVVEDAAHAPGATVDGRPLGGWGDVGCFSFFSNKNMTTGEGGMLTTNRYDVADRASRLRSHGMTTLTLDRHKGHAFSYDVVDLGYNYRMSELNAALGMAQLPMLSARNRRRAELVQRYRTNLRSAPGLSIPFGRPVGDPAYHLFVGLLGEGIERSEVMTAMKTAGIQTSIHYRPVDTFTSYRRAGLGPSDRLTLTHAIGDRVLTLPLYPSMTDSQVDRVCEILIRSIAAATVA